MRPLRAGIGFCVGGAFIRPVCGSAVNGDDAGRRDNPLWLSFAGFRRLRCESLPETGGSRTAPTKANRVCPPQRAAQGAAPTAPSPIDNHPVGVVRERPAAHSTPKRRGTHICVPYGRDWVLRRGRIHPPRLRIGGERGRRGPQGQPPVAVLHRVSPPTMRIPPRNGRFANCGAGPRRGRPYEGESRSPSPTGGHRGRPSGPHHP